METRLLKLKTDFNNIINIRNSVKNVFDILQIRIDKLRQFYFEFIQNNKNEMFVFGLDSFHFQSKLIDIEYDDMKRLFLAINNRMYCEYFKLNKIIVDYISKNINDKKITDLVKSNTYPIYKDLEPFKEYKFETILDIYENILNLLGILISILNNKENELSIHKTKQNIGLNIDNFITSFNFNISVMREKIMMFITYIEFFHKMHSKYLKRFSNKIQLMYTHINNDIKFDDSVEISKNKKKELIDEFNSNNIDKQLLKDLKISIGSETNSEVSNESIKSTSTHNSPNFPERLINKSTESDVSKSPLEINGLNKTNSFINMNIIPREKKDYRKIFQKNVNKVSNILQLCMPKENSVIDPKVSSEEIENIFLDIDKSCDSIIGDNNSNDGLEVKLVDRENDEFIFEAEEEKDDYNYEAEKVDTIEEKIVDTIEAEKFDTIEEKIVDVIVEAPIKIEELNQEPQIEEQVEPLPLTIENVVKLEEPIKKKRTYNKKKK